MAQDDYSKTWKKVDSLQNLGQLQTAREEVMKIYHLSKAKKQEDQLIKALLYRARIEENYLEGSQQEAMKFIEEELIGSATPVRQILWSVLAGMYQNFYQANRWQINQRTPLAGDTSTDLSTWDASRFAKIITHYHLLALSAADTLKDLPLSRYQAILDSDEKSRKYRPTLYDFLAFRALDYFTGTKPEAIKSVHTFTLNDPCFFSPLADFIEIPLPEGDEASMEFQAFRIYRELLRFRAGDPENEEALVDADLARLSWVHRKTSFPQKGSLYTGALLDLIRTWEKQPVAADVIYQLVTRLRDEGNINDPLNTGVNRWKYKEAIEWADRCAKVYPGTDGAHNCTIVAEGLKQTNIGSDGPVAVIPGKPSLALLKYRNLEKVWFRIFPLNSSDALEKQSKPREEQLKEILGTPFIKAWEIVLPPDSDYRAHSAEVMIPALKPGYYLVAASSTPDFEPEAHLTMWNIWSSRLSVSERRNEKGGLDIIVLDREEGTPVENVKVQPWFRKYSTSWQKYTDQPGAAILTDSRGEGTLQMERDKQTNLPYYLVLALGKEKFITRTSYAGYYNENEEQKFTRTFLFTDRAIYRPGQTVWFKGIVMDMEGDSRTLRKDFGEEVTLRDVNGQEVSKIKLVTNEFGSFTGSFVIPLSGLTGEMSLSGQFGNLGFRVEEYKRPKFEVVFDPVEGAPQLNREVVVKGKASAYAGSKISEASVTWRVVRNARFPYPWWWGGFRHPYTPPAEIASGTAISGSEGDFEIRFTAIPGEQNYGKFSPVFTYTVHAAVTSINGETHESQTTVSAGEESLLVSTNLTEAVNRAEAPDIEVTTTNLNGVPEKASGKVTVVKLTSPARFLYPRLLDKPDRHTLTEKEFRELFPGEIYGDEEDRSTWAEGESVLSASFETPGNASVPGLRKLQPGHYALKITTTDPFGKAVNHTHHFTLFSPGEGKTVSFKPLTVTLLTPKAEPGETASFLVASPLRKAWAKVAIFSKGSEPRYRYLKIDNEQIRIDIPVTEADRGNIGIRVIMVKDNHLFQEEGMITVPYSNKELDITVGSFRDKLLPGQEEEWRITIRDKSRDLAAAELLAAMYDASLDIFAPHNWYFSLYHPFSAVPAWGGNGFGHTGGVSFLVPRQRGEIKIKNYEMLSGELLGGGGRFPGADQQFYIRGLSSSRESDLSEVNVVAFGIQKKESVVGSVAEAALPQETPDLPPSKPRTNFRETAFFFPQLATNENGEIILRFTMPEALTRWRMMGLAHTSDLKTAMIEKSLITQKEIMVFPNAPRFLREGDGLEFSAMVSNLSGKPLTGTAELHFFDALTMAPIDQLMKLTNPVRDFSMAEGENAAVSWKITVPEGIQAVVYRITATAGNFSDGEEAPLPLLTNRMLVTESLPLPVRERSTKSFTFDKLVNPGNQSATLRNHRLTLEYTSNPAWYAVQALPYLMEFPHECAEQVFSRYYANTLASSLDQSDPAIRRVFDAWKTISPDALKSNLEKNEALKAVILQETPWVRDAADEGERKQRIGLLFDAAKMAAEQQSALRKMAEMQAAEGGWPWFPGMPQSETITRHILTGIGRLGHMKAADPSNDGELSGMVSKAIGFLDEKELETFNKLKKENPDYLKEGKTGYGDIRYLYARSFFLASHPFGEALKEMVEYYKNQASKAWKSSSIYQKGMTALVLQRMGDSRTANLILRSLTETSLRNEETGMYWRDNKPGWFWYEAPVETQALLIEAYDEISGDTHIVDELKVWLLKQKETQNWKTTKATADAVYALLKRGTSLLTESQPVSIQVGGAQVNPYLEGGIAPEPGTGYFKTSWQRKEISPDLGRVTVQNPNPGIAWGALYWQYFEQLDKITPAQTPLSLAKELFKEVNTPEGPKLEKITESTPLQVGDKVVVRVILKSDRAMEYVHLKDMRASAFEPLNVLSGYRWQAGLGYYESTRDAATHFFIEYLPKGSYVFEYRLYATQKGDFSNGITSVQCMYAPQFGAHSEGIRVKVE